MRARKVAVSAELESAFRAETRERIAHDTRWGVLNTLYMYPVFIPLDFLVYPTLAWTFVWIRLAVVALSIAVHFTMLLPFAKRNARYFAIFAYLYCTLAIVLMVHLAEGYASPYYVGIILVLICFLFILPLNVLEAAFACAVTYAAYIVPILVRGGIVDHAIFVSNNFFLVSTMVLAVVSAYLATLMRRSEFVSRFGLANANEELKKLDVLKSQFFASISHEIRTPLTSIMAPIQSLSRGEVGTLEPPQHLLVDQIHRNSLRLLDLINQMLDFAKFDAKKMKLHLKRVDMAKIVCDHVALFQEVCRRKGLTLEYDMPSTVPVVFLDQDKIERILSNLIRNALKFTDEGGIVVQVRTGPRRDEEASKEHGGTPVTDWITLSVRDTGIGIAPVDHGKVFQRFQQVDGSTTRRFDGTGLGLSIVKESVDLQHGRVSVESAEGEGSTFVVQLPTNLEELEPDSDIDRRGQDRRQEDIAFEGDDRRVGPRRDKDHERVSVRDIAFIEAAAISEQEVVRDVLAPTRPKTGIRVLYIEDNVDLRNYVSRMLQSFGHDVTTAVDGTSGWEQIQDRLPDIVVSDVMMPGIDGFEIVRLVKATKSTQKIPVLLITAKSETDSRIAGLEMGADDYLAKPIDIRDLDARIRNVISDRRSREALTRAEELELRIRALVHGFSRSLQLRDGYTADHSDDVLAHGLIIAEELKLPITTELREALLLHDIGKLGIPDSLLRKPGPLTPDEWVIMRSHPQLGAELLGHFEMLESVSAIVLAHHERFDGSGYPRGIAGDQIPIEARIISVADAWHAMREDRVYRRALSADEAVSELRKHSGSQFDPAVVERFLAGLAQRGLMPSTPAVR